MATDNRLILGIGLSHQVVVEGMWGMSFEQPGALHEGVPGVAHAPPARRDGQQRRRARHDDQRLRPSTYPVPTAPPVLVAALGTIMLKLAGTVADGTMTWMTGTATIDDPHRADHPRGRRGRRDGPSPAVGVSLPVTVTSDIEAAKERINEAFAIYPNLPSYKAMLDKEGAERAGDIAFVGDEESVAASIGTAGRRGGHRLRGARSSATPKSAPAASPCSASWRRA